MCFAAQGRLQVRIAKLLLGTTPKSQTPVDQRFAVVWKFFVDGIGDEFYKIQINNILLERF